MIINYRIWIENSRNQIRADRPHHRSSRVDRLELNWKMCWTSHATQTQQANGIMHHLPPTTNMSTWKTPPWNYHQRKRRASFRSSKLPRKIMPWTGLERRLAARCFMHYSVKAVLNLGGVYSTLVIVPFSHKTECWIFAPQETTKIETTANQSALISSWFS